MTKNLKVFILLFSILSLNRFINHHPNFTTLIDLSFYVPALLGLRYVTFVIISFMLTDLILGFHQTLFFTWGSVVLIGLISNYLSKSFSQRLLGSLISVVIFFIITNFGVWLTGMYGYDFKGLIACYVLAIPFFGYNLISTAILSIFIETIIKLNRTKFEKII